MTVARGHDLTEILSAPIGAEEALRNVARCLLGYTEVRRHHNGWGRSSTYAASPDAIAQTGRQLAEMVLAALDPAAVQKARFRDYDELARLEEQGYQRGLREGGVN